MARDRGSPRPSLTVSDPPLVFLPITSNDSGYIRHPEDPKHVYNKHHGVIVKAGNPHNNQVVFHR